MCFYTQKTLLLSGFEFLVLGGVLLGTIFLQKLIGDGLTCPTHVFNVENTCFVGKENTCFMCKNMCFLHVGHL